MLCTPFGGGLLCQPKNCATCLYTSHSPRFAFISQTAVCLTCAIERWSGSDTEWPSWGFLALTVTWTGTRELPLLMWLAWNLFRFPPRPDNLAQSFSQKNKPRHRFRCWGLFFSVAISFTRSA